MVASLEKRVARAKYDAKLREGMIGQLLLINGVKKISAAQVAERFALASATEKLLVDAKATQALAIHKKAVELLDSGCILVETKITYIDPSKYDRQTAQKMMRKMSDFDGKVHGYIRFKKSPIHMSEEIAMPPVEVLYADVKTVDLEDYADEIIPERVMRSIFEARSLGCDRFEVHSPVVRSRSEQVRKLKDPIVTFRFSGVMFEIDSWE